MRQTNKIMVELDEKDAEWLHKNAYTLNVGAARNVRAAIESALAAHDAKNPKVLPKPPRAPTTIYSPFIWDDAHDDADEKYCEKHGVLVCRPFGGFVDANTKHPVPVEGYPVPAHTQPRWVVIFNPAARLWEVWDSVAGYPDERVWLDGGVANRLPATFKTAQEAVARAATLNAEAARRNAAEK